MLDLERRVGLYWTPDHHKIPYWETSFPARRLLHWRCRDLPLQPVHAGAVGYSDGGVLITGESGSGKSTTCLVCLDSDLFYAGDAARSAACA